MTAGRELARAYAAIVSEARAQVAAGRAPDGAALEARIRAATRSGGGDAAAEGRALQQLERVLTVHRARARIARAPAAPPEREAPRRRVLRTRPTISGNMEVRREKNTPKLAWDAAARVASWEVRFSERAGRDYTVRETLELPPETTSIEIPLGEHPLRVHLLGRSRDGRLLRRAIISGLTGETWNERWQRRATAS